MAKKTVKWFSLFDGSDATKEVRRWDRDVWIAIITTVAIIIIYIVLATIVADA